MRGGFPGLGQLGLSDDQRQEVRRIMELHKAERQAIFQRLREARRAQSGAVMAVPVDEGAVRARSAELAKVEADAAVLRARVHAEVYNVLTPEQQEKAKALRAEREARGAQHREQWEKRAAGPIGEAVGCEREAGRGRSPASFANGRGGAEPGRPDAGC